MQPLPFELILYWALELSFTDLLNLSSTCHYYNDVIGENDLFWRLKFESRFHLKLTPDERTWKERCRTYGRIHEYNKGKHRMLSHHRAKQVSGQLFLDFENNVWSWSSPAILIRDSIKKIYAEYLLTQSGEVLYRGLPIKFPVKLVDIAAGNDHLLGLDEQGKVWGYGQNTFNQLGENEEFLDTPKQITDFNVKKIVASDFLSALITFNDELWIGGISRSGEIGIRIQEGFYFVQSGVRDVGFTSQEMFILTLNRQFKRLGHTRYTKYNINLPEKVDLSMFFDTEFYVLLDNLGRIRHQQGMDEKVVPAIQISRNQDRFIILER